MPVKRPASSLARARARAPAARGGRAGARNPAGRRQHPLHHAAGSLRNANPITVCDLRQAVRGALRYRQWPMNLARFRMPWLAGLMIAALAQAHPTAQQLNASQPPPAGRFIVKLHSSAVADAAHAAPDRIGALASRAGLTLSEVRHI